MQTHNAEQQDDQQEQDDKTPLMHAVVSGSLADVQALLEAADGNLPLELAAVDRWNCTPWLHAVLEGDIAKAQLLLDYGSDPSAHGRGGHTALRYAADDAPMARWLLERGANVQEATPFGDTALHAAAASGAVDVIPLLLAAGADVQASNSVQTQPIDEASNAETVRLLVAAGADINYVNGQGYCLLRSAAEAGDTAFVRALLDMGASPDTLGGGTNALHAAASEDAHEIMRLLLDAGADPNAQDWDRWGALWYARSTEAVQILLDAGVDVHLTDDMNREALANHSDIEIQQLLIAAGCYINPPTGGAGAPLREAVRKGDLPSVRFLVAAGADVNAATGWGSTPLMQAAEKSFTECVELLLGAGADVALRDDEGRTALHHAAAPEGFIAYKLGQKYQSPVLPASTYGYVESDSVDCLALLVQAGADLDAPDAEGLTPLMLAVSCGRPSRVAALLSLGASLTLRDSQGRTAIDHAAMHPRDEERRAIMALVSGAENK